MSQSEEEDCGNNKLSPSSSPPQHTQRYVRAEEYYYEDGSAVFLAGTTLFKLPASLLKADRGVSGYKFERIMNSVIGDLAASKSSSSDEDPIVLPLDSNAFELFLLAVFGRVGDFKLHRFLTRADEPRNHSSRLLVNYVAVGVVASNFGMRKLENWALFRIRLVLESAELLASQLWPLSIFKLFTTFVQNSDLPECQDELLTLLQFVLSYAAASSSPLLEPSNHLACAELYKSQDLSAANPSLFGFVFLIMLSLGHRSPVWTEQLTRDDRMILYAAHADLTRLHNHTDLNIEWLADPRNVKEVCSTPRCLQEFDAIWATTFARCERLDSPTALEDVGQIITLPKYRFEFAKGSSSWDCDSGCAQGSLRNIDAAMRELYCGFTRKYEVWARSAFVLLVNPSYADSILSDLAGAYSP